MPDTTGLRVFGPFYRGESEPQDFATYDGPHGVYLPSLHSRGTVAFCQCGWHPANHPGFIVADHLRDMA